MLHFLTTLAPAETPLGSMVVEVGEITRYRSLMVNLVSRDLKVRYKRSALGFLWTMLSPLLMMVVTTVVFANLFRGAIQNFAVYFLSAFLLWTFFSQSSLAGMNVMLGYAGIMRRVYVPKSIFVLSAVLSGLINLGLGLLVLLPIMLVLRQPLTLNLLWLPVPVLAAALFTLGLSLLIAALGIFFADVGPMYQIVLTAWMYLTPIMYPLEIVPPRYLPLVYANPMYYITETFRAPLYYGTAPDPLYVLYSYLSAALALAVGWWVFSRGIDRFVYYL
ncbi:MAG: ABC transporter permease [Anaerolineae bacterium]|nr:ABC transporter permease [Anaerolineae bacterium]